MKSPEVAAGCCSKITHSDAYNKFKKPLLGIAVAIATIVVIGSFLAAVSLHGTNMAGINALTTTLYITAAAAVLIDIALIVALACSCKQSPQAKKTSSEKTSSESQKLPSEPKINTTPTVVPEAETLMSSDRRYTEKEMNERLKDLKLDEYNQALLDAFKKWRKSPLKEKEFSRSMYVFADTSFKRYYAFGIRYKKVDEEEKNIFFKSCALNDLRAMEIEFTHDGLVNIEAVQHEAKKAYDRDITRYCLADLPSKSYWPEELEVKTYRDSYIKQSVFYVITQGGSFDYFRSQEESDVCVKGFQMKGWMNARDIYNAIVKKMEGEEGIFEKDGIDLSDSKKAYFKGEVRVGDKTYYFVAQDYKGDPRYRIFRSSEEQKTWCDNHST